MMRTEPPPLTYARAAAGAVSVGKINGCIASTALPMYAIIHPADRVENDRCAMLRLASRATPPTQQAIIRYQMAFVMVMIVLIAGEE